MNQKVLVPEENVPSLEQLKIPARVATKNALNLDKGIVGKYDGEFPLTSATVGGVYFVPQTKRYYECLKAFDGTTSGQTLSLPNADFKELSILENKNKLDNLISCYTTGGGIADLRDKQITKIQFRTWQSVPSVKIGLNKVNYRLENEYDYMIPISVNWKNNVHQHDYIGFDFDTYNGTKITVVYETQNDNMSYIVNYLCVKIR